MTQTLFTIGHSNRSLGEFVELLQVHNVTCVVDVRTVPGSRHNPHFNRENLSNSLRDRGIEYHHMKRLGGFRKPSPASPNTGWRSEGFKGFADYMQTGGFWQALGQLIGLAEVKRTAIMCAEAVPWRCHRSLIADALVVREVQVEHILGTGSPRAHRLNQMARVSHGKLTYPG